MLWAFGHGGPVKERRIQPSAARGLKRLIGDDHYTPRALRAVDVRAIRHATAADRSLGFADQKLSRVDARAIWALARQLRFTGSQHTHTHESTVSPLELAARTSVEVTAGGQA